MVGEGSRRVPLEEDPEQGGKWLLGRLALSPPWPCELHFPACGLGRMVQAPSGRRGCWRSRDGQGGSAQSKRSRPVRPRALPQLSAGPENVCSEPSLNPFWALISGSVTPQEALPGELSPLLMLLPTLHSHGCTPGAKA